jgi:hypothetical protein
MRVNSITWRRLLGRFEMPTFSPTSVVPCATASIHRTVQRTRRLRLTKPNPPTNAYWRTVSGVEIGLSWWQAGYKGGAELSGVFEFGANGGCCRTSTHFPERAACSISSTGLMRVVNDRVHTEDSYLNVAAVPGFGRQCRCRPIVSNPAAVHDVANQRRGVVRTICNFASPPMADWSARAIWLRTSRCGGAGFRHSDATRIRPMLFARGSVHLAGPFFARAIHHCAWRITRWIGGPAVILLSGRESRHRSCH